MHLNYLFLSVFFILEEMENLCGVRSFAIIIYQKQKMAKKATRSKSAKTSSNKDPVIAKLPKKNTKSTKTSTKAKSKAIPKTPAAKTAKAAPKREKKIAPTVASKTKKTPKPKDSYCPSGYTPQEYEKFLIEKNKISGYTNT